MLKSMTGYGRVKSESEHRDIVVEIKSVNHRYLDLTVKLPRIYTFLEEPLKKRVSASLSRGKADLYISISQKGKSELSIRPNLSAIEGYLDAAKQMEEQYGIANDLSASVVLRLPDTVEIAKEDPDAEMLTAEVMAVLEQALSSYDQMRATEGKRLCEDISERAELIRKLTDDIKSRSPSSVEEYRTRITARMEELLDGSELARQRILSEAALFADKVSVTEELVRLDSHLLQLDTMLKSKTAVGRKLDFLAQELNREANTIGSKANDFEIAKIVIDIKAEIEKIREQIQNLE